MTNATDTTATGLSNERIIKPATTWVRQSSAANGYAMLETSDGRRHPRRSARLLCSLIVEGALLGDRSALLERCMCVDLVERGLSAPSAVVFLSSCRKEEAPRAQSWTALLGVAANAQKTKAGLCHRAT